MRATLRPGGRFAVSDVVFLADKGKLPEEVLETVGLWTGCVVGALEKGEYEGLLAEAGFEDVSGEVTNVYEPDMVEGLDTEEKREALRKVPAASAFVRARKPGSRCGRRIWAWWRRTDARRGTSTTRRGWDGSSRSGPPSRTPSGSGCWG